jgi:hypothetical protein
LLNILNKGVIFDLRRSRLMEILELVLKTCWKSCRPMFEAAAIDVTDGTHPCFPPDFEEIEGL